MTAVQIQDLETRNYNLVESIKSILKEEKYSPRESLNISLIMIINLIKSLPNFPEGLLVDHFEQIIDFAGAGFGHEIHSLKEDGNQIYFVIWRDGDLAASDGKITVIDYICSEKGVDTASKISVITRIGGELLIDCDFNLI